MTGFEAVGLYIGLIIILMFVLKGNVGRVRVAEKVSLGDGGSDRMLRAIRAQGNAIEDVPIVLVGWLALAALSAPVWLIHILGIAFILGRILHAMGISLVKGLEWGRSAGTFLTALVMLATAVGCIWHAFT